MTKQKPSEMALTIAASLLTFVASTGLVAATPQELDCVLTDTPARPGSENRPVTVVYDEADKKLTAEADGRRYSFSNVTITYIAISGHADEISLGIDRSSLGIVWQQYGADKVITEYGHCRAARERG
jgi:hypothetical protein